MRWAETRHLHCARLGAVRRLLPTPAVPCAAIYAWGEDGSNQCPASYFAIVNAAACKTAAAAAGKAYLSSESESSSPSGCYFDRGKAGFFLNDAAVGASYPRKLLLCSGAALLAQPAEAPQGYYGVLTGYSLATIGVLTGDSRIPLRGSREAHGLSDSLESLL